MTSFCSKNFIREYWNSEFVTEIVKGMFNDTEGENVLSKKLINTTTRNELPSG